MYLGFQTHQEAHEFIMKFGDSIAQYKDSQERESEYIYSLPCRTKTEIVFCVVVKFDDDTEYYLQCEDLTHVLGVHLQ